MERVERLQVRIRLTGRAQVERAGVPVDDVALGSRKARTLVKLLAARRTTVGPDELASALWDGPAPDNAASIVASLVSRLRRVLGADAIVGDRHAYRLGAVAVDVTEARGLADEAARRLHAAEPALALAAAGAARDTLGDGAALVGEPDLPWVVEVRAEVRGLALRAAHLAATAALETGDDAAALDAAIALVSADALDEAGARLLMRAHVAGGRPALALGAYDELRRTLADELGTDPSEETQRVHVAVLRAEPLVRDADPPGRSARPLVGRTQELDTARAMWADAIRGRGGRLLVSGEAGIGKTRLVDELVSIARATGATVLTARCWEAERSLFLQPVVDAITSAATALPAARVRAAAGEHGASLVRLVPDLAALLAVDATPRATASMQRRRAFDAVTDFVRGLARDTPVLLVVDDLQHAGTSTLELLHFLGRRTVRDRVLVAATVRLDERAEVSELLGAGSTLLTLSAMTATDVSELAGSAGYGDRSAEIMRRTNGHPLFVIETLGALSAGVSGVPDSLHAAVVDRVARTGADAGRLLRAGAVLGTAFDPSTAAELAGMPPADALAAGERALAAGLLEATGATYEFAHDIVREVLLVATPAPTVVAYHRHAADLLAGRPEAVARHAEAAGDLRRAARAWLLAAEQALAGFAAADAALLATRALAAVGVDGDAELRGRALIARGRARDALTDFDVAYDDYRSARTAAREAGDRRLEMTALRQIAGDVPVALGLSPADCEEPLRECLTLATGLADRPVEADVLDRLTVLACSRLDFAAACDHAARGLALGRTTADDDTLVFGLDAWKVTRAYLGDVAQLAEVVDELEPVLRRRGDLWMLQWTVFERSFVALAAADWPRATSCIEDALVICRRSGYFAQEPFYLAHLGWTHRLAGRLDDATTIGRRAVDLASRHRHAWWSTAAASLLAGTLLAADRVDEAIRVLEDARPAADVPGAEAYLLRLLGPLVEATGSDQVLAEARALLDTLTAPPGHAWLLGADAYLGIARALVARGEPDEARAVLAPFASAAERLGWAPLVDLASDV